jgi:hypothetical protein
MRILMIHPTDDPQHETGKPAASAENRASHDSSADCSAAANPLEPLLKQLAELHEFTLHYLEARKDRLKASGRRLLMHLAVGVCGLGVILVVLLTSVSFVLGGLSQLVADALDSRLAIGQLIVGGVTLLALATVGRLAVSNRIWAAYQETKHKYERRHHAQRTRFGEDATDRASS